MHLPGPSCKGGLYTYSWLALVQTGALDACLALVQGKGAYKSSWASTAEGPGCILQETRHKRDRGESVGCVGGDGVEGSGTML